MVAQIQVSDEVWNFLNKEKKRGETFDDILKKKLKIKKKVNCLNCGKSFNSRAEGTEKEKKFCNYWCRKQYTLETDYNGNRTKEKSRNATWRYLIKHLEKEMLKKECKICNSKKNLQIHHEIYPTTREEIIKAIKEGKIYYLCKKHHKDTLKKNKKVKK